jgi:hypothetical protein
LENVIIKFVADTSGLEPAIKQLELLGKISKDDAAAFAQVNNEQKEFIQNLNKSTTEMGKLSNEVDGLMAEIQAGVMEGFADHLAEVTKETKQAGGGFKSMKQELKELKAQISSGSLGEKELREATKRAAELTDTIGDVNDKVKALASDTKRIDAVVTAFRGIAAAASVAAGAASLFGSENEKLTKTLAQAQGAMALLQGVQELANIATTEGALRTMVLDGAQKTAAVSARLMGTSIAGATAVATAGVSLLVIGLVALVSYLNDKADDGVENFNKKIAEIGRDEGSLAVVKTRIELLRKGLSDETKMRVDALISRNKSQMQFEREMRKDIKTLDDEFNALDISDQIRTNKTYQAERLRIYNQYVKDFKLAEKSYNDDIANINEAAAKVKLQKEKDTSKAVVKNKKEEVDNTIKEEERRLREEIAANQIALESSTSIDDQAFYFKKITELKKDQVRLTGDLTDSELILKNEQFDKEYDAFVRMLVDKKYAQDDYYDADLEAWAAAEQAKLDAAKEAADKKAAYDKEKIKEYTKLAFDSAQVVSDTIFTINKQNRDAETNDILESLSQRKDAELANKNLTDAQRLQIEERYQQQEAEIKTRAWEAQKQASIAQAIINGALAIGNILATVPGGPLNPATIASLALATITTAAQVAVISNTQPPKFADGGMVGGQLHSSGGTLIEAERGEYVINRQSTSDYLPSLKVLNSGEVEPTFANNILTALANGTFELAAQFQTKQSASSDGINYDKLDRIMAKHKSNLNVNIDEQGLTTFLLKENSRVEFRNKKMRYRA